MTMPINLRRGEHGREAGNQFAPARLSVPIAIADPAERMHAVHACVAAAREEPALPITEEVAGVVARLPRAVCAAP